MPPLAMAHILGRTAARMAIVAPNLIEAYAALHDAPRPIFLTSGGDRIKDVNSFDALVESCMSEAFSICNRGGSDTATVLFTTGSTGRPKGVELAHEATLFTIGNLIDALGYGPEDRELVTLPISHSFGLGHVYCNLFVGGAVHLENSLVNLKRIFDGLTVFRATGFPGTPTGVGLMIDRAAPLFAIAGKHLRFMVINSAPLPPRRMYQLQELLPRTEIFVYFGLTEASRSTLISLTKAGPRLYESVGRPMPGVEIKLDPLTQEILIRGPHLSKGYWQDDELTAEAFCDGWLQTGDIGRFSADNNLFVTGRLKDQINVGGYKADPNEIETVVRESGQVADAAVCGVEGASGVPGEAVVCAVIATGSAPVDTHILTTFCTARLESYKVPTHWVQVNSIPRAETGKIKRGELADLMRSRLERGTTR
jgi:long-chain acyl-CoA synthetase